MKVSDKMDARLVDPEKQNEEYLPCAPAERISVNPKEIIKKPHGVPNLEPGKMDAKRSHILPAAN
jgi:hypothetical protein